MTNRPVFVDPHVHLWDLSHVRYPWLMPPFSDDGPNGSVEPIASDYGLDEYLADAGNWDVRGIVHIDAGAHPDDALKETEWLQAMADARGMPSGIVAFAALESPELEPLLAAQAAHRNVRGIRHIINWHPDPQRSYSASDITTSDAWIHGFGLLSRYGLSFDLQAYPGQFAHLATLIARHPDTQVILDHTGMAIPNDEDGWEVWRSGMAALAALPNVAVKISGMGFTWRPWDAAQARPYVLETIDLFGTDRAMFASNFPTDKLFGSFDKHLDTYSAITIGFSETERAALFAGNANRIYRLGLAL
ncbi:putative TIM-barrel fold metal-dependent hydrolase [Sphingobium xanthum]|uniref:amidohydrolase family protein n=1 Tax=Sphingobium xanthum TaxID=1387165 RepID=UPI001C8BE2DC|nr:amidohydrolase family protein [Sphingobium xanthum]